MAYYKNDFDKKKRQNQGAQKTKRKKKTRESETPKANWLKHPRENQKVARLLAVARRKGAQPANFPFIQRIRGQHLIVIRRSWAWNSRISFLFIRAKITYFGFLTPYCRVDLERSPSKPYIRLSSNTAFHRIRYVSLRSSMEFCLLTLNWVSVSLLFLLGLEILYFLYPYD